MKQQNEKTWQRKTKCQRATSGFTQAGVQTRMTQSR